MHAPIPSSTRAPWGECRTRRRRRRFERSRRASSLAARSRNALTSIAGEPERGEEGVVALDVGIAGGEELLAVEDRIGAREEAQRLGRFAHPRTPGGQTHHALRHEEACDGDGAHELAPRE